MAGYCWIGATSARVTRRGTLSLLTRVKSINIYLLIVETVKVPLVCCVLKLYPESHNASLYQVVYKWISPRLGYFELALNLVLLILVFYCQLIQANSTHKTQLMELSLLREEEKQTYKRQEENLVGSYNLRQNKVRNKTTPPPPPPPPESMRNPRKNWNAPLF